MALDEALLEAVSALDRPVLRFYGWSVPAATFGYSQHWAGVSTWTSLRPLIRRPTGGGLVPHDADWTYSLVFPPDHPWYQLKALQSYRAVHEWIHRAFASIGVSTQLAPSPQKVAPGRCFAGAELFDLLRGGLKVAGAAQRRNRLGLLIQGSVQPGTTCTSRAQWEEAMLGTGMFPNKIGWSSLTETENLSQRADQLATDKYSQPRHNESR
jgi:lipoate-protein ligase A